MFTLLRHQPVGAHMLTNSVNLALGHKSGLKINVRLGPDSGLRFRTRAGFGIQNEARGPFTTLLHSTLVAVSSLGFGHKNISVHFAENKHLFP